jgi:hypothetical protein
VPPDRSRPSSPSLGFLGERLYYLDRRTLARVEAACVDVSTDWVPLFDIEIKDHEEGRIVETIRGVRGYTALRELVRSRGWERRRSIEAYMPDAQPRGVGQD